MSAWWSVVFLFVVFLRITCSDKRCEPLHSKKSGVNLVCCSRQAKLRDACEFAKPHYCHSKRCRCYVKVDGKNLDCSKSDLLKAQKWLDHKPAGSSSFNCLQPQFPNKKAQYLLELYGLSTNQLSEFISGMKDYRVTSLDLFIDPDLGTLPGALFDTMGHLRHLKIQPVNNLSKIPTFDDLSKSLHKLPRLEVLTLKNLSVSNLFLSDIAANFTSYIRRVQILRCSCAVEFPIWFSRAFKLEQIQILETRLSTIEAIQKLPHLRMLYVSSNRINRLNASLFDAPMLEDIDLSNNFIPTIEGLIYSNLPALKFLDLSSNPIKNIPERGFSNLPNLNWMRLENTNIIELTADHFLGASSLKHLSLARNNLQLAPFSLMPLTALETLDLSHCNLTVLPEAVTQVCELKQLRLNFNLFHSPESMKPETLLQLGRLRKFVFSENPLSANPIGLFLLPRENVVLLESVVASLKQLPAWFREPICTPYLWRRHLLAVDPPLPFSVREKYRAMFPAAGLKRISEHQHNRCLKMYNKTVAEVAPYKALVGSGHCESVRRLRSLKAKEKESLLMDTIDGGPPVKISTVSILEKRELCAATKQALIASLVLNVVGLIFTCVYCVFHFTRKLCPS